MQYDGNENEYEGEFSTHPIVDAITAAGSRVKVSSLWILPISVDGVECKAMSDSGAEVPVVSSRLINLGNHEVVGRVTLRSVFGHTTNAPLVNLTLQLNGWYDTLPVSILCAIADINTSRYDVILPQDVVNQLHERSAAKVNSVLIGAVTVDTACDEMAVSPVHIVRVM